MKTTWGEAKETVENRVENNGDGPMPLKWQRGIRQIIVNNGIALVLLFYAL